ncbi:MAG: transcriptional repressor LexA, partial [Planctomycetota bacterium]
MRELTTRQRAVLDWVVGFVQKHGLPPTLREIGKAFRISSPGVLGHLRALERKGYVKRGKLGARSLEIAGMPARPADNTVELPVVGRIAAGVPLLAVENREGTFRVDRKMLGRGSGEHFALRVTGDSMIEDGIFDGDTVVVRKQETANDGDNVYGRSLSDRFRHMYLPARRDVIFNIDPLEGAHTSPSRGRLGPPAGGRTGAAEGRRLRAEPRN